MKQNFWLKALLLTLGVLLVLTGCSAPAEDPQDSNTTTDSVPTESESASEPASGPNADICDNCSYGEWVILRAPTCEKEGVKTHTCTVCGTTQTAPIDKTQCLFGEWVVVTPATETALGLQKRTCAACGAEETEEIPMLSPLFNVTCDLGGKRVVVTADEDGNYTLTAPVRLGYDFMGWTTEAGEPFAATGTLTANAKAIAKWELAKTTTFAQLKERIEAGVDRVLVDADIVLSDTIYVTGETTVYVTANRTLIRNASFLGDLFVLGETPNGENVIVTTGKAATLTLRVEGTATLTLNGNKTEMAEAANGTAFFLLNSSTLNLYDNVTVTNCKKVGNTRLLAEDDNLTTPHRAGGAAVIVSDGVLNLYGATISNCEVNTVDKKTVMVEGVETEEYNDSCCGGAIFNRSTVNMYSGTLRNNQASRGGAIFSYRSCNLKGGMIEDNYAENYGGALYMVDSQYAYSTIGEETDQIKLIIRNNTSKKSGGAVFGQHMSVLMIWGGVEFNGNKSLTSNGGAINMPGALTVKGGKFTDNVAASKGGALYLYYSDADQTIRQVDIAGGIFEGNEAAKGGALGIGASSSSMPTGAKVTIGSAIFRGNRAFLTEEEDPTFIDNTDRDGVTKKENGNGGAIYVFYKGDLTINGDALFEANHSEAKGGAIYVTTNGSKLTVDASAEKQPMFLSNVADGNGGAIYMYTNTALDANYATFRQNTSHSTSNGGGAVYFSGATGELSNVLFDQNESDYNGGAVCTYSESTVTLTNVTATANEAANAGGFLYTSKSTVTVEGDSSLEGNKAIEKTGGAISVHSESILNVSGATFTQNTAKTNGGAIYIKEGVMNVATTVTFNGNSAEGGGGAIYLTEAGAGLIANEMILNGNHADGNGGALYLYTDSVTEIGTLIAEDNVSEGYGGAIYASGEADVEITSVTATGNEASKGGFLYLTTGGTTVTILGGSASENVATDGGATAYSNSTSSVLEIAESFTYPADTITGKSGFSVTVLPAEANA